jgi:hypothetical protein
VSGSIKQKEPVRHEASARNRRKALHNAECLLEEVLFLQSEAIKHLTNLKYLVHRANTLVNRLKGEVIQDK